MQVDVLDHRICYLEFSDPSPATACGVFLSTPASQSNHGFEWDFYARFDHWCFALSRDPNIAPDATLFDCESTLIAEAVFIKEGTFGKPGANDASHMSIDDRLRIIRECITEFEKQLS